MNLQPKLNFLLICAGLMMTMTSCVKEEITPTDSVQTEIETETESISQDNQSFELQNSSVNGDFSITIDKTECNTGGYTLTVNSPEVDLSNGNYTVNWYKNTEQVILSVGQSLECVCGFGVRVEVIDETETVGAKDSLDIPSC